MSVTTLELGQAYLIAKFESYVFTCCGLGCCMACGTSATDRPSFSFSDTLV